MTGFVNKPGHAILLNPALSVRGERYEVVEGKTSEITVTGARALLASIDVSKLVGLRDRAVVAPGFYRPPRNRVWGDLDDEDRIENERGLKERASERPLQTKV